MLVRFKSYTLFLNFVGLSKVACITYINQTSSFHLVRNLSVEVHLIVRVSNNKKR